MTTFRRDDLSRLGEILNQQAKPIEVSRLSQKTREKSSIRSILQRAGLHPTAEQIEMFAYYLPKQSLSSLIVMREYL